MAAVELMLVELQVGDECLENLNVALEYLEIQGEEGGEVEAQG